MTGQILVFTTLIHSKLLRNDNNTIYEIVIDPDDDYLCCVRSTPNTTKAPIYGPDGQTTEERNRFPVTITSITTTTNASSGGCQNNSDCPSGYECNAEGLCEFP